MCLLGAAAPAAPSTREVHLGEVEEGLDAAAQVHDGEDADADLAVELHKGVVGGEGHEGHRRQVVDHDDGQDGEHHLEGLLLDWVPHAAARRRSSQDPHDGKVAENHDGEGEEDGAAENAVDALGSQDALAESVGQDEPPDQHGNAGADPIVPEAREQHRVDHGGVAVQTDTHLWQQMDTYGSFCFVSLGNALNFPKI